MPPDEPAMPSPPAPRKRTQFASFLTDTASDLTGFEPTTTEDIGTEARPIQTEPAARPETRNSAQAKQLPPSDGGTDERGPEAAISEARQTSHVMNLSTEEANSRAAGAMRPAAPTSHTDIVKISVKVDAVTFLELKRTLRLRETLQEFCLNAITRELGARTGKA